tara:strand:+ start:777 stop:1034 length:258 start_codon:yes stop_codon:yes gene_type:complete
MVPEGKAFLSFYRIESNEQQSLSRARDVPVPRCRRRPDDAKLARSRSRSRMRAFNAVLWRRAQRPPVVGSGKKLTIAELNRLQDL